MKKEAQTPVHNLNVSLIVREVLSSSGQPLDEATRSFMELGFGHDFSKVQVYTDNRAKESARSVNALAYTVGTNIVFGEGQYRPGSAGSRKLLAHELSHVVQQRGGTELSRKKILILSEGITKGEEHASLRPETKREPDELEKYQYSPDKRDHPKEVLFIVGLWK